MYAQQVLIYHVQFTLPNATTRATAALQNWACWLASVLQPLAADWKPRPGAYSLKLTDGRPTGFRSTPSPRRPLVLAPRQKHRERKESYTHILTRQRLHVAVLVPLVEHVHALRVVGLRPRDERLVAHLALDSVCYCSEHDHQTHEARDGDVMGVDHR